MAQREHASAGYSLIMGHAGMIVRHADGLLEGAADPRSEAAFASAGMTVAVARPSTIVSPKILRILSSSSTGRSHRPAEPQSTLRSTAWARIMVESRLLS